MNRWSHTAVTLALTLTILALGQQVYAADQVNLGIVLNEVMQDIGAPLTLGGALVTLFGLGQVISSNPAGWILRRRGPKFTLSLGICIFSLFTLLTGLAGTFWDASIYRIGFGVGQGIWNVTYYSIIGTLFVKRRGLANAVFGLMYPIGVLWGAPVTALMFIQSGWRTPFYMLGISGFLIAFTVIVAVKSATFKRPELQVESHMKNAESYWSVLKIRNVAFGCILGVLYSLMFSSVLALYPTFLRTILGFDPVTSGFIISVQTWAWIIVAPIILTLSDRYGRKLFLCFCGLFSAFTIYCMFHIPSGNFPLAAAANFIYGVAGAGTMLLIIVFVQDSVTREKIGASTGFINFFMYIGVTVSGPITGYIVSLSGWNSASYWLVACSIMFLIATLFTKETLSKVKP